MPFLVFYRYLLERAWPILSKRGYKVKSLLSFGSLKSSIYSATMVILNGHIASAQFTKIMLNPDWLGSNGRRSSWQRHLMIYISRMRHDDRFYPMDKDDRLDCQANLSSLIFWFFRTRRLKKCSCLEKSLASFVRIYLFLKSRTSKFSVERENMVIPIRKISTTEAIV